MTLDEAIKHAEEVAREQEELYRLCPASESMFHCDGTKDCRTLKNGKNKGCRKCAEEHQQLAEWLKDYQQILKERHFDDAKKHFDAIYKLAQTTGMTYSFVEARIEEMEEALVEASPQLCDDAISRQAVLDALDKSKYSNKFCEEHHIDWSINLGMAHIVVNELKPVAHQPKMGRWIIGKDEYGDIYEAVCSCCGINGNHKWAYCPNCGAKMEVQNDTN